MPNPPGYDITAEQAVSGVAASFLMSLSTGGANRLVLLAISYESRSPIVVAPAGAGLDWQFVLAQNAPAAIADRIELWQALAPVRLTGQEIDIVLPAAVAYTGLLNGWGGGGLVEAAAGIAVTNPAATTVLASVTTVSGDSIVAAYLGCWGAGSNPQFVYGNFYSPAGASQSTGQTIYGERQNAGTTSGAGVTLTPDIALFGFTPPSLEAITVSIPRPAVVAPSNRQLSMTGCGT